MRKAFREQRWDEPHALKFVTYMRHPAARVLSAWNHFVKEPGKHFSYSLKQNFGLPALPFREWVEQLLLTDLLSLDQHLRPQVPEIYDRIVDAQIGAQIYIGQLEQANQTLDPLIEYVGRSVRFDTGRRHPHDPWLTYYDKDLLERTRRAFAADMALWNALVCDGYWISDPKVSIAEQLTFAYS